MIDEAALDAAVRRFPELLRSYISADQALSRAAADHGPGERAYLGVLHQVRIKLCAIQATYRVELAKRHQSDEHMATAPVLSEEYLAAASAPLLYAVNPMGNPVRLVGGDRCQP
jgi:hypothetical protein